MAQMQKDILEEIDKIGKKFKGWERKQSKGQKFGRPKIKKCGKEIDVFDWIQEGREDTEIYPTLEKYGSIEKMVLDHNSFYADITGLGDLRGTIEKMEGAKEIWNNIPLETKKIFNNNIDEFVKNGQQWAETQNSMRKAEENKIKAQETMQKTEENTKK